MANALDDRFNGTDLPPGVPAMAMGTAPTRATPVATAPTLGDRAKGHMDRALAGLSSLLGRAVTPFTPVKLPPQTPNVLATVPRIATPTPAPPVTPPRGQPEPYALNTWLSQQTSK